MPCLALDSSNNVAIPFRQVFGIEVVRVRILLRLRTQLGEWLSDTLKGLPWKAWTGHEGVGRGPTSTSATATVRAQLESISGVVEVLTIDTRRTGKTVSISATILAAEEGEEGTLTIGGTFDPFATSPAPAWFVVDAPTGLLP